MHFTEYKSKTLMKYEADKAGENGADSDDTMEVTNKSNVEGEVGKNCINYNFQHTR